MGSSFAKMDIFHGSDNRYWPQIGPTNPTDLSDSMFNNFLMNRITEAFVNGTNVLFLRLTEHFT